MSASLRAVLVDDCQDMRDLVRLVLARAGHRVVGEAGDGMSGVLMAQQEEPDLVVLDLNMPVMDGFAALPVLREALPRTRVVVFSQDVTALTTVRLRTLGADAWVRKGEPLRKLLAAMEGPTANPPDTSLQKVD